MKKRKKQGRRITRKPRDLLALYRLQCDFLAELTRLHKVKSLLYYDVSYPARSRYGINMSITKLNPDLKTYEVRISQPNLKWMPFVQKVCHKPRFHHFGIALAHSEQDEDFLWFIVRFKWFDDTLLQQAFGRNEEDHLENIIKWCQDKVNRLRFTSKPLAVPWRSSELKTSK